MSTSTSHQGTNQDRQSEGLPGHCDACEQYGHIAAHPELGCSDVGCSESHETDQVDETEDHEAGRVDDTGTVKQCGCGAWDDLQGDHRRAGCPAEHLPIGATVYYLGLTQTVVARTGIYQTGGKAASGHSDMVILVLDNGRGWPKPVEVEAERLMRRA